MDGRRGLRIDADQGVRDRVMELVRQTQALLIEAMHRRRLALSLGLLGSRLNQRQAATTSGRDVAPARTTAAGLRCPLSHPNPGSASRLTNAASAHATSTSGASRSARATSRARPSHVTAALRDGARGEAWGPCCRRGYG